MIARAFVPRRETWLAAALLFSLLAIVHYDVVFLGRSLVLTNYFNPLDYRPLPQNYGGDMVPPEVWTSRNIYPYAANIRDAGGPWWQWEPDGRFFRRAMEIGEWPFWDPYVGAGTPAMANMTPGYFFPPYTLLVALGASVPLQNGYFLLLLWCAGFFTWIFLRDHGLSFVSALFGGMVVMMSGGLNQHIGTIGLQTAACLPVTLYVTRVFLDSPTGWRAAALAIVYASTALASFPPILMWVFGVTALYALTAIWLGVPGRTLPSRVCLSMRWAGATVLSIGLVAFFYMPALALRESVPYVVTFYDGVGRESMPLSKLFQLLSPTLMGGVPVYINSPVPGTDDANLPYVGIVALVLACLAHPGRTLRVRLLFYSSVLASALILMKLFGIPPVHWIARLPLFDQIHYAHYFGMSLSFLVAFLAAIGLDALLGGTTGTVRAMVVATLGPAVVLALWWVGQHSDSFVSPLDQYWIRDWRVLLGLAVLSALTVVVATVRPSVRPAAVGALVVLVSAEGFFNNAYPSPAAWDIFDHPVPYVSVLKRDAGMKRVLPFGALSANLNSAFEIFSFGSLMTINPTRAYDLYRRYTEPPSWLFLRDGRRIPPEPVLDRVGIGFLAVRDVYQDVVKEAHSRGYAVRFNDGYAWLFERPTMPRFLFSSEYRVLRAPAVLSAIATAPPREILIEQTPDFPSTANAPGDADVRVDAYRRNSATLTVDAPRPGLVYAAESYFDGWTATVNAKPARILAANYAFRAVEVPAGVSRIEFRYWPPGLTAGLSVTALSGIVLVIIVIAYRPSLRKERATGT